MLLTCTVNGWGVEGYPRPGHPLQGHIRETVERLAGEKIAHTRRTACGAPRPRAHPDGYWHGRRIATAPASARSTPSPCTATPRHWPTRHGDTPGLWRAPEGSTRSRRRSWGCCPSSVPRGCSSWSRRRTTAAVKNLDGGARAAGIVALRLLERAGALPADRVARTAERLAPRGPGGGRAVGEVRAVV